MKETIYTIPVNEAFSTDCECPICYLENDLEKKTLDYMLGASMMEPDSRIGTNKNGFCRRHFTLLFNVESKKLPLALVLDTHMIEQIKEINDVYSNYESAIKKEILGKGSFISSKKKSQSLKFMDNIVEKLDTLENSCSICDKMSFTMDKYFDVILYQFTKDEEFRSLFSNSKGFCIKHYKELLEKAKQKMSIKQLPIFLDTLTNIHLNGLKRVQDDVNWFTKKFDYRYENEPWKNSKDAIKRSIEKIVGFCNLNNK